MTEAELREWAKSRIKAWAENDDVGEAVLALLDAKAQAARELREADEALTAFLKRLSGATEDQP